MAIGQETQHIGDFYRIVKFPSVNIGLAQNHYWGAASAFKQTLHSRERHRLVFRNVAPLLISSGENHQRRCGETGDHPYFYESPAELFELMRQQIEGAHRCHDRRPGNDRSRHVVQVLPDEPSICQ
jgi:hypothetical protein